MNKIKKIKAALWVSLVLPALFLTGCSSVNLPPVTEESNNKQLPGKIIWHDLITDKPVLTKKFYQTLFGWEFEDLSIAGGFFSNVNYTLIRHEGKLIGGMVDQTKLPVKADISQWVVLMSVRNINQSVDEVKRSGGIVFSPVTDLGDRGKVAIVADPQGALLGFIQTKEGDPQDRNTIHSGDFLWNELWTSDVNNATSFYQRIAEYSIENRQIESGKYNDKHNDKQYRLLTTQNKPRVAILDNPIENLSPVWVSYLRVDDAKALDVLISQVEALGGEILLAPQDRDIGGRVAFIAGPSGAGIALQTWPKESKIKQAPLTEAKD